MWIALCESTSVVVHFCQHNFPKCHHAYIRNNPCLKCLRASMPRMNFISSLYIKWLTLFTLSFILDPTTIVTDNCFAWEFFGQQMLPLVTALVVLFSWRKVKASRKFQSFLLFSYFLRAHYLICLRPLASLLSCTSGSETCNT